MLVLAFERLLKIILALYTASIFGRYLGVDNYGELSFILAVVSLFFVVSQSFADGYCFKYLEGSDAVSENVFNLVFVAASYVVFFSVVFLFCAVVFLDLYTSILCFGLVLSSVYLVFDSIFLLYKKNILMCSLKIFLYLFLFVFRFYVVYLDLGFFWVLFSVFLELFLMVFFLFSGYIYFSKFQLRFVSVNYNLDSLFANFVKISRGVFPVLISGVLLAVFNKMDVLGAKYFFDSSGVGVYAAVMKFNELTFLVFMAGVSYVYPRLLRSGLYNEYLGIAILLTFLLGLVGSGAAFIIGRPVFIMLYGESFEYENLSLMISIGVLSGAFAVIAVLNSYWLIREGLSWLRLMRILFVIVFHGIAICVFSFYFGLLGIFFALLFSQILMSLVISLFDKRTRSFFFLPALGLDYLLQRRLRE